MKANSVKELFRLVEGAVTVDGNDVTVTDEAKLRKQIDAVVYTAVFGDGLVRDTAR